MLLIKNNKPTPLNRTSARSFHMIDTINHRKIPTIDNIRSQSCIPSIPRSDIAVNTMIDATHLIYQSTVYFGVADLKIRLLFFNSSLLKSVDMHQNSTNYHYCYPCIDSIQCPRDAFHRRIHLIERIHNTFKRFLNFFIKLSHPVPPLGF